MDNEGLKNFIKWGGDFPPPFEGRGIFNNNHLSVLSKQAGGVVATNRVSRSIVAFILKKYSMDVGVITNEIALGNTLNTFIAERYTVQDDGSQKYTVSIYNEIDKSITAFIVDFDTNAVELYPSDGSHSGMVLLMSLWEELYKDEEFFSYYQDFCDAMNRDNEDDAWDAVSVLSDNIYRRFKNDDLVLGEINGNISTPSEIEENIAKGTYTPSNVVQGTFKFLLTVENTENLNSVPLKDFIGKYPINPNRVFTNEEKIHMANNKLEDYYIVGDDDIEICNDIVKTTNMNKPFRTFTLVGPPGTGKSHKVKAIANAIVLPNYIFTCNPSTEIFDLTGQVMPPDMDDMDKAAWNLAARIEEQGGLNFKNIANIYQLPNIEDVRMCPSDVYEEITGNRLTERGTVPTLEDALKVWSVSMTDKFNEAFRMLKVSMKTGTSFKFTETDFIKAVEKGYCVEIQEPNVILNEGVLVGLNSILNEGVITLQNGRTIKRHPDNVVFFTTNHDLNGLRDMNQSFLDRSSEIFYVERPSISVVADRVMAISGNTDRSLVIEMCKLSEEICAAMEKESIDDGVCGIRSIINWATKATYCNPYDAAIKTMVNKTSLDDRNRSKILRKLNESYFYQFKNR